MYLVFYNRLKNEKADPLVFKNNIYKKVLPMNRVLLAFIALLPLHPSFAQEWTEEMVIERALAHYPGIRLTELEIIKQRALERTAFNPSQPRFEIEAPTDVGTGFEVEQEFDWPGVYTARSKWLQSQTSFSEASAIIARNELIRDVRLTFLEAQIAEATVDQLHMQDSLWNEISERSQRLYDAGEINRADLVRAQKESSLRKVALLKGQLEYDSRTAALRNYTGEHIRNFPPPDQYEPIRGMKNLPLYETYSQNLIEVERRQLALNQARRWPGLIIGYLKAPEPETAYRNRYKAGITIPIWQGQYRGEVEVAKISIEQKQVESRQVSMNALIEKERWENILNQTAQIIGIFEKEVLPQSDKLYETYLRLYDAGEMDYALTLRNISDSFAGTLEYLEALQMHNQAVVHLDYLNQTFTGNE